MMLILIPVPLQVLTTLSMMMTSMRQIPPPPPLTNDEIKPQIPHNKWLTEGGYRLVHKPKNNCELKAGTTSSRVFVNSSRQTRDTKKYTLKTVKSTKRDSGKNNQKISVFVSRLDPTFVTSSSSSRSLGYTDNPVC